MNTKDRERIDHVFQFTMDNFKSPIQLKQVAEIAAMSIPAFCNFLKGGGFGGFGGGSFGGGGAGGSW